MEHEKNKKELGPFAIDMETMEKLIMKMESKGAWWEKDIAYKKTNIDGLVTWYRAAAQQVKALNPTPKGKEYLQQVLAYMQENNPDKTIELNETEMKQLRAYANSKWRKVYRTYEQAYDSELNEKLNNKADAQAFALNYAMKVHDVEANEFEKEKLDKIEENVERLRKDYRPELRMLSNKKALDIWEKAYIEAYNASNKSDPEEIKQEAWNAATEALKKVGLIRDWDALNKRLKAKQKTIHRTSDRVERVEDIEAKLKQFDTIYYHIKRDHNTWPLEKVKLEAVKQLFRMGLRNTPALQEHVNNALTAEDKRATVDFDQAYRESKLII